MVKPSNFLFMLWAATQFLFTSCDDSPMGPTTEIGLNTRSISLSQQNNQAFLIITNIGAHALEWNIPSTPEWLGLSKASGRITDNADTVQFVANLLFKSGKYEDVLKLTYNGGQVELNVSYDVQFDIDIFPGKGAAQIALGDNLSHIFSIHGFNDSYLRIKDSSGDTEGHIVLYPGFGIWLQGTGLLPAASDTVTRITCHAPYAGVTEKFIGIGSSQSEIISAYGPPLSINSEPVSTFDGTEIQSMKWNYQGLRFYFEENSNACYRIDIY